MRCMWRRGSGGEGFGVRAKASTAAGAIELQVVELAEGGIAG